MPRMPPWAITLLAIPLLAILGAAAWLYTPDKPRQTLVATYAQPPSTFLPIAGITLHLRDTGPRNAPAVILLHGFGSSLHTWDAWATALEPDHRVIRFDLPGFGLTGPDPTGDYSDTRATSIILALLDHLQIPRASLVGNSMGGRIAWQFAAAHPERTDRLVLISPDGFPQPGETEGMPPRISLLLRILPYTLPTALLRSTIRPTYGDPATLTEPLLTRYRDMLLAPGVRRAILARTAQHTRTDPTPTLRRITAPTLLLWGDQDRMIPITNAPDYLAAIPGSTLLPLPGLGHVPQEEPPPTAKIVRTFLDAPPPH